MGECSMALQIKLNPACKHAGSKGSEESTIQAVREQQECELIKKDEKKCAIE